MFLYVLFVHYLKAKSVYHILYNAKHTKVLWASINPLYLLDDDKRACVSFRLYAFTHWRRRIYMFFFCRIKKVKMRIVCAHNDEKKKKILCDRFIAERPVSKFELYLEIDEFYSYPRRRWWNAQKEESHF